MKHLFVIIAIITSLLSCEKKDNTLMDFKITENLPLTDSIVLEQLNILNPHYIQYKDSFLIFSSMKGEREIQFLNLCSQKVVSRKVIGQGANEMPRYSLVKTSSPSSFCFADHRRGKIYTMDLEKLKTDSNTIHSLRYVLPTQDSTDYFLRFIETEHYIYGIGLFQKGRIYSYNKHNQAKTVNMDYPANEEISKLDMLHKGALFTGTIMVGNDTTLVLSNFGLIDFYKILPNGNLKLKCKRHYFFPKFFSQEQGHLIVFERDDIYGFSGTDADEKYVYILYSGRNMKEEGEHAYDCPHLLVYDWNGKPVKHYKLSRPLYDFCIAGKTLYGLSRENDPIVYVYSLEQ